MDYVDVDLSTAILPQGGWYTTAYVGGDLKLATPSDPTNNSEYLQFDFLLPDFILIDTFSYDFVVTFAGAEATNGFAIGMMKQNNVSWYLSYEGLVDVDDNDTGVVYYDDTTGTSQTFTIGPDDWGSDPYTPAISPYAVFSGYGDAVITAIQWRYSDGVVPLIYSPKPLVLPINVTVTAAIGSTEVELVPDQIQIGVTVTAYLVNPDAQQTTEYRLVLVDMNTEPIAELSATSLGNLHFTVAEHHDFTFLIQADDPNAALCQAFRNEVQVYRGSQMLGSWVITRVSDQNDQVSVQLQDPSIYFNGRVFGPVPKLNQLEKGGVSPVTGPVGPGGDWEYVSLPRSKPRTPPAHSFSLDVTYNEFRSMALSSSVGMSTRTLDNDTIYSGNTDALTSAGKSQVRSAANDSFGVRPLFTVIVYDDNRLSRAAARTLAQARCDTIVDYILGIIPGATIQTSAMGSGQKVPNNSSDNKKINRYTSITYRDDDGTKGHAQCARQQLLVKNPNSGKRKIRYTFSAYYYIQNEAGFASGFRAMELVRSDNSKKHPDPKWATEGYKKPVQNSTSTIGKNSPIHTWIRMETSVVLANNGKRSVIEARLFPPNGDCYVSEIWLTTNDALWFKNDEQGDIITQIVQHAQDETLGKSDLGIDTNIADTNIKRTRTYKYEDRGIILAALDEFPTLADGVEWDVVCQPTGRTFTTFFPRRGRETNIVLADGSNGVSYGIDLDGTLISTTVIVMAPGGTYSREERASQDSTLLDGLVLEMAYTVTPNSPAASWQKQADKGLARYRRPVIIPTLVIDPKYTTELLASLWIGDRLTVLVKDGWIATAQRYRLTELAIDPQTDSLALTLYPEDIGLIALNTYKSTGWKYHDAAQSGVTNKPVQSHPEYAAHDFDDSGWSDGQAGIGWVRAATGDVIKDPGKIPNTVVTTGHEVWARKTVQCTGDMILNILSADWAWVYVNGNLVNGTYFTGFNSIGRLDHVHKAIPAAWLDASGTQVVTIHAQYDPSIYSTDELDSVYADVAIHGTFDARLIT